MGILWENESRIVFDGLGGRVYVLWDEKAGTVFLSPSETAKESIVVVCGDCSFYYPEDSFDLNGVLIQNFEKHYWRKTLPNLPRDLQIDMDLLIKEIEMKRRELEDACSV